MLEAREAYDEEEAARAACEGDTGPEPLQLPAAVLEVPTAVYMEY